MFRVLRPLRLISRCEGMRLAVTLLIRALPGVLDVLLVYVLFLVVFAILGVQIVVGDGRGVLVTLLPLLVLVLLLFVGLTALLARFTRALAAARGRFRARVRHAQPLRAPAGAGRMRGANF